MNSTFLIVSDSWKEAFPGACVGILAMEGVSNPPLCPALEREKEALQVQLRSRFAGQDRRAVLALSEIQAYNTYYRSFKKTYPVQLQLESVAMKGHPLPSVAALVEAMYLAEVKNLLLTAGHDLDTIHLPVNLQVSQGGERYTLLRGEEQVLKPGDMMMADRKGVISSIIYGPDRRTCITPDLSRVLFAVYAPAGIGESAMEKHLYDLEINTRLVAPDAKTVAQQVFTA